MGSPSIEDHESTKDPLSLEDQVDFEAPASDEEGEFTGNGAVANSTSMETSSSCTEKEPSPSQSSSSDDEVDSDDLENLNIEQLQVLLYKAEAKARIMLEETPCPEDDPFLPRLLRYWGEDRQVYYC